MNIFSCHSWPFLVISFTLLCTRHLNCLIYRYKAFLNRIPHKNGTYIQISTLELTRAALLFCTRFLSTFHTVKYSLWYMSIHLNYVSKNSSDIRETGLVDCREKESKMIESDNEVPWAFWNRDVSQNQAKADEWKCVANKIILQSKQTSIAWNFRFHRMNGRVNFVVLCLFYRLWMEFPFWRYAYLNDLLKIPFNIQVREIKTKRRRNER